MRRKFTLQVRTDHVPYRMCSVTGCHLEADYVFTSNDRLQSFLCSPCAARHPPGTIEPLLEWFEGAGLTGPGRRQEGWP